MKLVESEAPIDQDDRDEPVVTPPRPPHRRVSVSLVLTLAILVGTVVTIYLVFPARHHVLLTEALAQHRDASTTWELATPTAGEAAAWTRGVFGDEPPMPSPAAHILGVRRVQVLDRDAAILRLEIGDDHERVTYAIQRVRGVAPDKTESTIPAAGSMQTLRAVGWRRGKFTIAAVGNDASADRWLLLVR